MSLQQYFDAFLIFCLIFITTSFCSYFGLRRSLPSLVASALGVMAISELGHTFPSDSFFLDTIASIAAIVSGPFCALLLQQKFENAKSGIAGRFRDLIHDFRLKALIAAMCIGILITFFFARAAVNESPRGFWHGFYEAWTASLVFFGTIGIASLVVALYRPEKEAFFTRVRILCGGRDGPEVDYIMYAIRQVGYYVVSAERSTRIMRYDRHANAFLLEVTSSSTVKNFYDDKAVDVLKFYLKPDEFSVIPNSETSLGQVSIIRIDNEVVCYPIQLDGKEFVKEFPVTIPKQGSVNIHSVYQWWVRADKEHTVRSFRFSKSNNMNFMFDGLGKPPSIRYVAKSVDLPSGVGEKFKLTASPEQRRELEPRVDHQLLTSHMSVPDEVFFTYHLEPHPLENGSDEAQLPIEKQS